MPHFRRTTACSITHNAGIVILEGTGDRSTSSLLLRIMYITILLQHVKRVTCTFPMPVHSKPSPPSSVPLLQAAIQRVHRTRGRCVLRLRLELLGRRAGLAHGTGRGRHHASLPRALCWLSLGCAVVSSRLKGLPTTQSHSHATGGRFYPPPHPYTTIQFYFSFCS